jgi:hypothetical protein
VCVVKGMLAPMHARSVLMEKKDAKQAGSMRGFISDTWEPTVAPVGTSRVKCSHRITFVVCSGSVKQM